MRTITAHFDRHSDARRAVEKLEKAGIDDKHISIISNKNGELEVENENNAAKGAGTGAGIGAVAGGVGGLLTGLGLIAIPGVGPVVAAGWLATTLAGAAAGAAVGGAAGGIIGALQNEGLDEKDANFSAEYIRRGGSLVVVKVEDNRVAETERILQSENSINVTERRRYYEESGWTRFDENAPPYTNDQIERERKQDNRLYPN